MLAPNMRAPQSCSYSHNHYNLQALNVMAFAARHSGPGSWSDPDMYVAGTLDPRKAY